MTTPHKNSAPGAHDGSGTFARRKIHFIEIVLLMAIFLCGYGLLIIGAAHSYPSTEDLYLSAIARDLGPWRSILDLMMTYDGRYATNFMHAFNPLVHNSINGYKLMAVAGVGGLVLSIYFLLATFIQAEQRSLILSVSLLFGLVFFGAVLSLPCVLYWMGGSFVYLYPCLFCALFITYLIRYINQTGASDWNFFICAVSLLIGIGFNEMFLPFYALLLSGLIIYYWLLEKTTFFKLLPIILLGFSCILFFVSAPGVSVRLGDSQKVITAKIFLTCFQNLIFFLLSTLRKPIVFCSILYVALLFSERVLLPRYDFARKKIILICLGILSLTYIMSAVYHLPKQVEYGYPIRIYPPILFFILIGAYIMPGTVLAKSSFANQSKRSSIFCAYFRILLLSSILLNFIWGNNNIAYLYSDLRSLRMHNFMVLMNKRTESLLSTQKTQTIYKSCIVPKLNEAELPASIYAISDEESNRNVSLWNKYQEEYFKLNDVMVVGDTSLRFR